MAAPSMHAVDGALRETEEYAAAFDLEVWKAQQQLRYQAQLREAKESLERRLRAQMRETEGKRLAELEALRHDLEMMGRRLQAAEEAVAKRTAQLDAREAAFNARRVKVAEQHESYVSRAEERERRTREEAQLTQSSLQARLQEKDRMIVQLQERLTVAQNEYDLLRRRAARYLTEHTDTGGQKLRDQECALALAHTQLAEAQRHLREKSAEAQRLAEDKANLQSQVREATRQLTIATRKYSQLSEASQTREWEHLRKEQEALEAAKRSRTLEVRREQVYRSVPEAAASAHHASPTARAAAWSAGGGSAESGDGLYDMIAALKREVGASLNAAAATRRSHSGGGGGSARPLPFRIVERLPGAAPAPSAGPVRGGGVEPHSTTTSRGADASARTQSVESAMAETETSSVSAALSAIQRVQPSPSAESSPLPVGGRAAAARDAAAGDGDVVVDMGDTSMESYYPRAELQSWPHSLLTERDEDPHAVAPLPSARAGTLPPLAPELRGIPDAAAAAIASSSPSAHLSPTPDDFVLSRAAPTTEASRAQAARRDMVAFVQQLKMNREKLLETGVYGEQDSVVREMGEKIRMYEAYLTQHP